MIPKTIHYCWFGRKPLPRRAKIWMRSWGKYCPDYKIIEWNEDNFDYASNLYALQAYEAQKWAFVSDYARLYVLYHYGGVYMDTDVELLKPIDRFLEDEAFSGFEGADLVSTGIMACEKGFAFFKNLLDDYDSRVFIREDSSFDYTPNVVVITRSCVMNGLRLDNSKQTVVGFTLYPKEYFCPKDWMTKKMNVTTDTYAIHHFKGSWIPASVKIRNRIIYFLIKNMPFLVHIKRKLFHNNGKNAKL